MLLTEGQMNDHKGARLMLEALPKAKTLIADTGYDSDWFRAALNARGTEPCIKPTKSRKAGLRSSSCKQASIVWWRSTIANKNVPHRTETG